MWFQLAVQTSLDNKRNSYYKEYYSSRIIMFSKLSSLLFKFRKQKLLTYLATEEFIILKTL